MTSAIISLAVLGGIFGIALAFASKKFRVEIDSQEAAILEALPGSNCGACGYPSCGSLARAIREGKAAVNACIPGRAQVANRISEIMGVDAAAASDERLVVQLHCGGGKENCRDKYLYDGIKDCRSAVAFFGGHKECAYGCIGLGTCASVCPFGAISMGENELPEINYDICTGCMICVNNCPQKVLDMVGASHLVHVRCSSPEKGKVAKEKCSTACIKCRLCEKVCPEGAIQVVEFKEGTLARIDYEKCTNCGLCVEKCPTGAITIHPRCFSDEVDFSQFKQADTACQGCPAAGMCSISK